MNEQLKSCPFCGKNPDLETKIEFEDGRKVHYYAVVCTYCEAQGPGYGFIKGHEERVEKMAIEGWNNRHAT